MTARRVDQDLAKTAAGILRRAEELTAAEQKALRTRYRQMRVMLHTAGLAATYAFAASKAGSSQPLDRAYSEAAGGIRKRLVSLELLKAGPAELGDRQVLSQLGDMDGVAYARASAEAASLVGWLSRLADACYLAGDQQAGGEAERS
ncbi:MAG TPA: type III-B CRISPR module-associated protein Cmr5 [Streptosporangiaceae bacterium]|nr:type III-B CRISPR module-associated protein Cmr5 [Streptosporangiaceae bacterium]